MANQSREDVLFLLDDVVSVRQQQPLIIQDMYMKATLSTLIDVKFEDGPKPSDISSFLHDLPKTKLDLSKLDELETNLLDQLQILHILSTKKNSDITKILNKSNKTYARKG